MGEGEERTPSQKKEHSDVSLGKLGQITALLKVTLWPLVVLIIYFQLHGPIAKVFEELPAIVARSSKLSVGSISLEVQGVISTAGDMALADKLKGIPESEFETLLDLHTSTHYWVGMSDDRKELWLPSEETLNAWVDLERRGLVKFTESQDEFQKVVAFVSPRLRPGTSVFLPAPLPNDRTEKLHGQIVSPSEQGEKVVNTVLKLVVNQLAASGKAQGS